MIGSVKQKLNRTTGVSGWVGRSGKSGGDGRFGRDKFDTAKMPVAGNFADTLRAANRNQAITEEGVDEKRRLTVLTVRTRRILDAAGSKDGFGGEARGRKSPRYTQEDSRADDTTRRQERLRLAAELTPSSLEVKEMQAGPGGEGLARGDDGVRGCLGRGIRVRRW